MFLYFTPCLNEFYAVIAILFFEKIFGLLNF